MRRRTFMASVMASRTAWAVTWSSTGTWPTSWARRSRSCRARTQWCGVPTRSAIRGSAGAAICLQPGLTALVHFGHCFGELRQIEFVVKQSDDSAVLDVDAEVGHHLGWLLVHERSVV